MDRASRPMVPLRGQPLNPLQLSPWELLLIYLENVANIMQARSASQKCHGDWKWDLKAVERRADAQQPVRQV